MSPGWCLSGLAGPAETSACPSTLPPPPVLHKGHENRNRLTIKSSGQHSYHPLKGVRWLRNSYDAHWLNLQRVFEAILTVVVALFYHVKDLFVSYFVPTTHFNKQQQPAEEQRKTAVLKCTETHLCTCEPSVSRRGGWLSSESKECWPHASDSWHSDVRRQIRKGSHKHLSKSGVVWCTD